MQRSWSVRTYLSLLALAVAVPCAVVLVYSIAGDAQHDRRQIEAATLSLAQLVAAQAQQFLSDAENVGLKLAQRPLMQALDPNKRDPIFDQFLDLFPQFANLVLCDASGRVIHTAREPGSNPLDNVRAQWSETVIRNGRFTVGKPILGRLTERWVCVLGQPVKNASGQIVGALGMSVDLARFHVAVSPVNLPPDSTLSIVDREGAVLMRYPGGQSLLGRREPHSEIVEHVLALQQGNTIARDADGDERIYGFTTISRVGWRVYAGIPTSYAFATTRVNTWRASLMAAALLGLVVALVLLIGRRITEPVSGLFAAASSVAEGKSPAALPVSGPTELAAVAAEFNRMLASRQQKEAEIQKLNLELEQRVAQRTGELERANASLQDEVRSRQRAEESLHAHQVELQDYIDSMSTMSAKVAPDGALLLVNKIAQQASGLPIETLMKTNFLEGHWWTFDAEVQRRVRVAFEKACSGETVNYDEKLFIFGKIVDINLTLSPVRDAKGEVGYIVAEGRDITQRKRAEASLAERSLQLETANRELEAFAYSVSHDLRAPLRAIDGFSKALLEDYQKHLDEGGREYLERVRSATLRMSQLIDDLLQLSRISRSEMKQEQVNLSLVAAEIAQALKETAPQRAATFALQPGLVTHGDARLLRVVLENLLSNAWKFSRDKAPAQIEFGQQQVNGTTAFFVRDNGAGFDMTYSAKLFGAFQRLHTGEQYEGTGIGLATVQRIIHRHGGRVWAYGEVDKGATFYFTVPG